jgi:predicted HAD superfamily Cof-like phosphohydrolase
MNRTFENCTLLDTHTWFKKAVPEPQPRNLSTQFGVHLEEVGESLAAIQMQTLEGEQLLQLASDALEALGDFMKTHPGCIDITNSVEFLDGLCDQIVTATGTAYMAGYDIVGAMTEVNASNFSKFDKDGQPIFNENGKIMKGPNFFKPDLAPYIPG